MPGEESKTVGIVLSGWTVSMITGVSISAIIADYLGWRAVYSVITLGSSIVAIQVFKQDKKSSQKNRNSSTSIPLSALKIPKIKSLLLCVVLL